MKKAFLITNTKIAVVLIAVFFALSVLFNFNITVTLFLIVLYIIFNLASSENVVKFYFFIYLLLFGIADRFYFPLSEHQSINFNGLINILLIITAFFKFCLSSELRGGTWPKELFYSIIAFVLILITITPFSTDFMQSCRGINRVVSMFALFLLSYFAVLNNKNFHTEIFNFITIIFILLSIYGIFEYFSGYNILMQEQISDLIYVDSKIIGKFNRVSTVFSNASQYSFALLIYFPLYLVNYFYKKPNKIYSFGLILLIINLILTFTRISWISFLVQVILFIFMFMFKPKKVIVFIVLLIPILLFMFDTIINRLFVFDSSAAIRFELFKYGFSMFKENLLFGNGLETFLNTSETYFGKKIAAHGDYMRIFAETGILGGVSYFAVLFSYLVFVLKRLKSNDFAKAALLTIVGYFIFSITDNALAYGHFFWGLMGIYTALIIKNYENLFY